MKTRDKERLENLYKLQSAIGSCDYATWYFYETFENKELEAKSQKIKDLCDKIVDLINECAIYDED